VRIRNPKPPASLRIEPRQQMEIEIVPTRVAAHQLRPNRNRRRHKDQSCSS
jgi:hypothetical protein